MTSTPSMMARVGAEAETAEVLMVQGVTMRDVGWMVVRQLLVRWSVAVYSTASCMMLMVMVMCCGLGGVFLLASV